MFELYAKKNQLAVGRREAVTSGSVNVYPVRFRFSEDWAGLEKTAVFRAGERSVSVLLDETGEVECVVPWEVLAAPGLQLEAGVYGTRGGDVVLPTVWADLGYIETGAAPGEDARPPTPELWQQQLARKGDGLGYTDQGELGLYAGKTLLGSVPIAGGGGEGGTSDHRFLSHRDAERQHPMSAIDGLEEEIRRIPPPAEPLSNLELEELLK